MRVVAQILIPLLAVLNTSPWVIAAEKSDLSDTKILHQPVNTSLAGLVIPLTAGVTDSAGVEVVRVYFKSTLGTIYYYIPLVKTKNSNYSGILPAAAADAGEIEYLILVKNNNGVVVKSQHYQIVIAENPDKSKADAQQDKIKVYSESPYASKYIIGFEGGYDFQVADPSEKYGVVAGLYNPESVSWISTDAVSGGTVADSSEKSLNPWLIGGAAVAGVAVVAVALGGGGSSGGGDTPPETPEDPVEPAPPANPASGSWILSRYEYNPCSVTGAGQTQTVTCTTAGTFQSVSPSTLTVTVADTAGACVSGTTRGLAEVFAAGQACDAVEACNSFSVTDLVSKNCQTNRIELVRSNGNHIQVWEKQ